MTGHSQGSSLAAMFASRSHRLFTSATHICTHVHAAQVYTSALFKIRFKLFALQDVLVTATGFSQTPTFTVFKQVRFFQL